MAALGNAQFLDKSRRQGNERGEPEPGASTFVAVRAVDLERGDPAAGADEQEGNSAGPSTRVCRQLLPDASHFHD